MAIEEKLNALNLPPDSKEYALAVYECLVEVGHSVRAMWFWYENGRRAKDLMALYRL